MSRFSVVLIASVTGGCVAPNVVVVDQKTALEVQAAGGYPTLQNELDQAGMAIAPVPYAREELVAGRARSGNAALGELAELYVKIATDADTIDQLLLRGCVGEAQAGVLEPRPKECMGATDATELARLVGRENLHRRQLWELLAKQTQRSVEQAQSAWHEVHVEQVVCGGLIEAQPGVWKAKAC